MEEVIIFSFKLINKYMYFNCSVLILSTWQFNSTKAFQYKVPIGLERWRIVILHGKRIVYRDSGNRHRKKLRGKQWGFN